MFSVSKPFMIGSPLRACGDDSFGGLNFQMSKISNKILVIKDSGNIVGQTFLSDYKVEESKGTDRNVCPTGFKNFSEELI